MDQGKLQILTAYASGFISKREGQNQLYLCFKNLLLTLTIPEFFAFREMIKHLLAEQCTTSFPDGSNRMIVRTPYDGICFSFLRDEILQLTEALDHAYYMQKIYVSANDN